MEKIWDCIHIFGKYLNLKDRDCLIAYICFFHCLVDLLPYGDIRYAISEFLKHTTLENEINNGNVFMWSYQLHFYTNYIRKEPLFSLEQINQKYDNVTIDAWSNAVWHTLHFIAANLPDRIDDEMAKTIKSFLMCVRYLIPCEKCRNHMEEYIFQNPIDTSSSYDVFLWTYLYHRNVDMFARSGSNSLKESPQKLFYIMRVKSNLIYIDN